MTIRHAGHIVYTNEAIFGSGRTLEAALEDSRQWLSHDCDPETDPDVYVSPASDALLAEIAERGGAIAWGKVDGICCTVSEAETEA